MPVFDRNELTLRLSNGVQKLPVTLNEVQLTQLVDYLALLAKWNSTYNLTAIRDPAQMVTHHLLDSLAVVPAFSDATNVLDVGAGGGLPGLVLAVARPEMHVSLIDTVHKKTAFLTQVKAELQLKNVTVYTGRVEQLQVQQKFDVITSRAFADILDFINWSAHLLQESGRFIALKGVKPDEEIARLPAEWRVADIQSIDVPGLGAERHLVFIENAKVAGSSANGETE